MKLSRLLLVLLPCVVAMAQEASLSITKTHASAFAHGQQGATYTVTVSNAAGAGPTSGDVTVTENPPPDLTLVSMAGVGWTCPPGGPSCTRNDALNAGQSYPPITVTVNVSSNATSPQTNEVSVTGGGSVTAIASDPTTITNAPASLSIAKTHTGNFQQGQHGATYSIVVSNAKDAGLTNGDVTVVDTPPNGMTLVSLTGAGWNCHSNVCRRKDALGGGQAYPTITATVNIASSATTPLVNQANVSWNGGSSTANTADSTAVTSGDPAAPVLSITKSHTGDFQQGQQNATYTVTVSNGAGASPTSGEVTVTDTPPGGETLVSMGGGPNWNCTANTCTRSDELNGGASYDPITVTVNLAANANSPQVNQASVSGGGSAPANTSDSTNIISVLPPPPALSITKTHTGNFQQGQQNATYTVTVSNAANASPTSGAVTVTDTLPAGETLVSMSGGPNWSCTANSCARSDALNGGASYDPITVTVDVAANATSPQVNQVSVSGGGAGTANANDSTAITTAAPPPPSLTISKTHTGNFQQGQQNATYTVVVGNAVNAGPTTGAVTVTDTLPPGEALVSMSGGPNWSCTANSCARSDALNGGANYDPITVTVNVAANATSPQVNQAGVSGGGSAPASANDSTTISSAPPQLSVSKTHAGSFTQGQQDATYTVTVANAPNAAATSGAVTVTDTPPSGETIVSMAGSGWICGTTSCTRSDVLAASSSYPAITVTVNVAANAASPQVNAASVSGGGSVTASANDSTVIGAAPPSLTITKTHSGNFAQGQQNATYAVTVSNAANAGPTSGAVTVTDAVPSGETLVSMAGAGWSCTSNTCTRSDALNGNASYPPITVTVNVALNATSPLVNSVSLSGGGSSPANANDSTVIVAAPPLLGVTKVHTGNFSQGQQNATYTITVSNTANSGPTNGTVTVTDTVPTGMTLASMSGSGWSCTANTCTRGDVLNGGASYPPITAAVNVAANATSPLVNQVNVTGGGSAAANASDSTVISPNPATLSITKSHTGSFTPGQQNVEYTVTVSNAANAGPTSGTVTVTDTVPSGLTFVAMSGAGWSCTANTCTRSDALNGGSNYPAITVTASVNPNATSPQVNSASVSGGGSSTATANDPAVITLVINTSTLPDAVVQAAYAQTLAASGGQPPFTWSIAGGALPAGLNLVNGQIAGTPTAAGTANFNVQVKDSAGATATKSLSIRVADTLTILACPAASAVIGQPYSAPLNAAGGVPPYKWSLSGTLPAGLNLNQSSGVISGAATQTGASAFTLVVADSNSAKASTTSKDCSINAVAPLTITTGNLNGATKNLAFSQQLSATGGTAPYSWTVSGGALPAGIALSTAGALSGAPTVAGSFQFGATVKDSGNLTANKTFALAVAQALTITSCPAPSGIVGQPYNSSAAATGGQPPYTWNLASGALPSGLALNVLTGSVTGAPAISGTFPYSLVVTDRANATNSLGCALTIAPALSITTTSLSDASISSPYTQTLVAAGGSPPYFWSLGNGAFPPGLSLSSSGTISGSPTQLGAFKFSVSVTDTTGATVQQTFTITVFSSLIVGACPAVLAELTIAYNSALVAQGGSPPYTWSISNGSIPAGLGLNSKSGVISGTPTQVGTNPFTIAVSDVSNHPATRDCGIEVKPRVTISTTSLADGNTGAQYSGAVAANGGIPPYVWSTISGSLPPGVSLDSSSGKISGQPVSPGAFPFTVQVTDSAGAQASGPLSINVAQGLNIPSCPTPVGSVGQAYSAALVALGGTQPYTWAISSGSLPAGLTLSSASSQISGTPSQAGTSTYALKVNDAASNSATRACSLQIGFATLAITSAASLPNAVVGAQYSQTLTATGGTPPYSWSIDSSGAPSSFAVDASGKLTGIATTVGTYTFTIQVSDSANNVARQNVSLTVLAGTVPALSITGLSDIEDPLQQPSFNLQLSGSYPSEIDGTLTLTFTPDPSVGVDDPSIQFASGGRSLNFTIPANSTSPAFAAQTVAFQTGTVAGTIQLSVKLTSNGIDITPSNPVLRTVRVDRLAPKIVSVSVVKTSGGFEVHMVAISTTRELTQGTFNFTLNGGGAPMQVVVSMSDGSKAWFQSSASTQYGGQFSLVQPFTLQGQLSVSSVSVTLTNGQGTSDAATANF